MTIIAVTLILKIEMKVEVLVLPLSPDVSVVDMPNLNTPFPLLFPVTATPPSTEDAMSFIYILCINLFFLTQTCITILICFTVLLILSISLSRLCPLTGFSLAVVVLDHVYLLHVIIQELHYIQLASINCLYYQFIRFNFQYFFYARLNCESVQTYFYHQIQVAEQFEATEYQTRALIIFPLIN